MESAAVELDSQGPIFDDEIDVDSLLQGFPYDFADDLYLWSPNSSPVGSTPNSPKESETPITADPFAEEIERFLMEDDGQGEAQFEDDGKYLDEFMSDVLVGGSGVGSGSGSGMSEVASPESGGSAESAAAANGMRDDVVAIDGEDKEEEEHDDDNDDQISKKRRRQMRNRESAMQSRERKKLYVKDLEMKSKYLEAECRRLDYTLRCCMAENAALHQRLQKDGALAARQESAVLFVESLLVGSLFWLVSIVYLFLVPSLQTLNQKDASGLGRGLALEDAWYKTILSKKLRRGFGLDMVIMRRRCRGLRTRMKAFLFPLHCLSS